MKTNAILAAAAIVLISVGGSNAAVHGGFSSEIQFKPAFDAQTAIEVAEVRRGNAIGGQKLANPKRVSPDTCDQSYADDESACDIDQLTQRCDDAEGGMSSLPGGGVDCDLGPED